MSDIRVRRYGDPSAPRVERRPWVLAVVLAVLAFAIFALVSALIHWIQLGDRPHLLGAGFGIAFSVLLFGGLAVGWVIYWRPLRSAYRHIRARHLGTLVLGARIPHLGDAVMAGMWPPSWSPALPAQRVVLLVGSSGIAFYAAASRTSAIFELTWEQVTGVAVVEYVESGVAYEGVAIEGSPSGSAVVVQMIRPSLLVRFPRGKALRRVVTQIEGWRQSRT